MFEQAEQRFPGERLIVDDKSAQGHRAYSA